MPGDRGGKRSRPMQSHAALNLLVAAILAAIAATKPGHVQRVGA